MIGRDTPWFVHLTQHYAAMIRDGMHFALASYGDGEWQCILGKPGENCDGTKYTPELGLALADSLLHPVGQWCSFFDVVSPIRDEAIAWIERHRPPVHWIAQRPYGRAAEVGELAPFLRAIKEHEAPVIIVGPDHIRDLPGEVLGPFVHVRVPNVGAWQGVDSIGTWVKEELDYEDPGSIVLFAAGMASNLLIHRLWRRRHTMLDVGALLDPYCGVQSRRIYRDPVWQRDMKPRNLA